jgi:hypothetical protein
LRLEFKPKPYLPKKKKKKKERKKFIIKHHQNSTQTISLERRRRNMGMFIVPFGLLIFLFRIIHFSLL